MSLATSELKDVNEVSDPSVEHISDVSPILGEAEVWRRALYPRGDGIPVCQVAFSFEWECGSLVRDNDNLELVFESELRSVKFRFERNNNELLKGKVTLVLTTSNFQEDWPSGRSVSAFINVSTIYRYKKGRIFFSSRTGSSNHSLHFGDVGKITISNETFRDLPEDLARVRVDNFTSCAKDEPLKKQRISIQKDSENSRAEDELFKVQKSSSQKGSEKSSPTAILYHQHSRHSNHQYIESPSSFQTAISSMGSLSIYSTAPSRPGSLITNVLGLKAQKSQLHRVVDVPSGFSSTKDLDFSYMKVLRDKTLLLDPNEELNWSGKGQHVKFSNSEEIPLKPLVAIGHGGSALVDSVLCRRIKLARKKMILNRRQKLENVISEVEHLQRLRHPHIVQLVGSYIHGREFAILIYPVAEFNLSTFLDKIISGFTIDEPLYSKNLDILDPSILVGFQKCLSHALEYIHMNTTKHMDIKPQNILLRKRDKWHVYLADFGISKHFTDDEMSKTDSVIPRSKIYCSPEVYEGESKGRSSDVFSMGCVFLEMETVLASKTIDEFADFRSEFRDADDPLAETFHDNLKRVNDWIDLLKTNLVPETPKIPFYNSEQRLETDRIVTLDTISSMLIESPDRPTMSTVRRLLGGTQGCCLAERERYEVAEIK